MPRVDAPKVTVLRPATHLFEATLAMRALFWSDLRR